MWESWHIFALRQRIWPLIPGLPKNDQNMMQNLRSFGPKFCFNPWLIGVIEFATMRPFSWNWFQGYFIKSLHLMIICRHLKWKKIIANQKIKSLESWYAQYSCSFLQRLFWKLIIVYFPMKTSIWHILSPWIPLCLHDS